MGRRFGRGCSVGDNPRATAEVPGGADKAKERIGVRARGVELKAGGDQRRTSLARRALRTPATSLAPASAAPL